jgi:osmotically-inducible protein OsmY
MRTTNIDLESEVKEALDWSPQVDARHIAVSANGGALTLSGNVPTYLAKTRAVDVAERVFGVKAVADELEVRLLKPFSRDDSDIAESIARVFESNVELAKHNLKAKVAEGHVTLTGSVDWNYERVEAQRAVARILGVTLVLNHISVKPRATAAEVQAHITNALTRHAALDARQIHVAVSGDKAVLSGHVHSLDEARSARTAAWAAPGISQVEDLMTVELEAV